MDNNLRKEIALFRYSLIAPLIANTFTQSTAKEYIQQVSAKKYKLPNGDIREYAPATIKEWLRQYRRYGIDGLYPKVRSDKNIPRKISKDIADFIVSSKMNLPKRTAKSIYHELVARGMIKASEVSISTIQRFIANKKISTRKLCSNIERKPFEFEFPNDCWQSDISVGPYINIDGKKRKTFIFAFLDDSSRLIVHCEAFFVDNLLSLLASFKKAVAKRGIPKKLFVDNGKVYQSGQMQLICASLGTILSFARPYSPESKGKIERWFKTLHDQWMNISDWNDFSSLEHLNQSLSSYSESYNSCIHSSIDMKPILKFTEHIDNIRFVNSSKELDYIFLYRVTRKVKNDATISLNNIIFEVPQKYIGENISLRYSPDCLDKAFVFSDDNSICDTVFPAKKIDNSKVRRNQNINPVDFSSFSTDFNGGM